MRFPIPTLVLACSLGLCAAEPASEAKTGAFEKRALPVKEKPMPVGKSASGDQESKKAPVSQADPDLVPDADEPEEGPEDKDEAMDCDDCVVAEARPGPETPGQGRSTSAGSLWGLFLVAGARRFPKTWIHGVTIR